MPVILTTQEEEMKRIPVQSQPEANSSKAPFSKKKKNKKKTAQCKKGLVE
jgi:hypothetical protein